MANIYSHLLRDVEQKQFGASLTNIILLKKGEVAMATTKKLVVIYDGDEYEPVNCRSVKIQFEGDAVILTVVLKEDEPQTEVTPDDIPTEDAVISTSPNETFELQGDNLEAFEALSDFRDDKNQGKKESNSELETYIVESETYDIQDLQSVQNAIFDLIEREKEFLNKEYTVFKYTVPKFDYKDGDLFKLVESVVLIAATKTANELAKETK
jgi:hypothetical protein